MRVDALDTHYTGPVAASYVDNRVGPKWLSENAAVEELLANVPQGATVLDAPVGTGRFFPIYKSRTLQSHGIDVSPDMLAEASQYAEDVGVTVGLMEGDIRHLPYSDNSFDVALCVRFLNLAGAPDIGAVVKELARVSRGQVLIGVRYLTPFRDIGAEPLDLIRRCARLSGLSRYRAVRMGRTQYAKSQVEAAIEGAGLRLLQSRLVERRWDGTDYAFLLLGKVSLVGRT